MCTVDYVGGFSSTQHGIIPFFGETRQFFSCLCGLHLFYVQIPAKSTDIEKNTEIPVDFAHFTCICFGNKFPK
ncbi:hypothetical protein Y032_0075g920 [Ancylostoma ceylanicum]|uniref:Uncharacterized protein n=1 Tax=Ancylostoma ceylanicum TaxID=53326 RepID=A0A016TTY0_9BILA|nr:hypothetical protein Y032_0075g920 [Ancylostoma ceylanicum]